MSGVTCYFARIFAYKLPWHTAWLQRHSRETVCKGWRSTTKLQRWFLLAKDDERHTAWHLAPQHVCKEILEKMWVWDRKVQLTQEDELLLFRDKDGQTAWHGVTQCVCKEILEHLWVWARDMHINLKYDLLCRKSRYRQTARHKGACCGYKEVLEKLVLG
jgi:hypothetical protein